MAKQKAKTNIKKQKVTFSLNAPEVKRVAVLGDFNEWSDKKHPMKKMRTVSGIRLLCCQPEDTSTDFWWIGNGGTTQKMIRPAGTVSELIIMFLRCHPDNWMLAEVFVGG